MRSLIVDGPWLTCVLWWGSPHDVPARFERLIEKLASEQSARVAAVAWDGSSAGNWRRTIEPSYKMHRGPKPALLWKALIECHQTQLRHVRVEGFEADDIIATLAWAALAVGDECVIVGADKDLAQLVTPRCWLVSAKGVEMREADVLAKFGVPPARIRHLLSWTGDSADGLPGKAGVGPKRGAQRANTGAIGDELTYELAGLATVPGLEVPPCEEGFA